jgi:hypothetical protein
VKRLVLAGLALATLTACVDSSTAPSSVSLVGEWSLQSVNGSPLPYVEQTAEGKLEILSGAIVITAAATHTTTVTELITVNSSPDIVVTTTYGPVSVDGSTVIFKLTEKPSDPGTVATLSSNALTLTQDGRVLVFVKS